MEKLLTTEDVRQLLNLKTVATVRNIVKSGKLRAIRYSSKDFRYRPADVEAYIGSLASAPAENAAPEPKTES